MKLLTLSAKVKAQGYTLDKDGLEDHIYKIEDYDKFLDQPLTLGMFVPCKDGKPLGEPEGYRIWASLGCPNREAKSHANLIAYEKAKEAVIFEGFKISNEVGFISNGIYRIDFEPSAIFHFAIYTKQIGDCINMRTYTLRDLSTATIDNPLKLTK